MADQEPAPYRPRRAAEDHDGEQPAESLSEAPADSTDEDEPNKPLYRDEVEGADAAAQAASDEGPSLRRPSFVRRAPRADDDDATTLLPRTRGRGKEAADDPAGADADDLDGSSSRRPLGARTRYALIAGAVAAIAVIGIAIGYAILGVGERPNGDGQPNGTGGTSETGGESPGPESLLTDQLLLSPEQAAVLAKKQTWTVTATERGASDTSADAACFTGELVEGEPAPQQTVRRILSTGDRNSPSALHKATAYSSNEEAAQAFVVASKTLGSCDAPGSYLVEGYTVTSLGDQAVSAVVSERDGSDERPHSVIISRSGRVLNVLDATASKDPIRMASVAAALGQVNAVQCRPTGGTCTGEPEVAPGPPPLGGDQPGLLAFGDLPPAGPRLTPWVATAPEAPKEDFVGSNCETVNWSTVSANSTTSRVYLLQDSGKSLFGLNEIVLTFDDEGAAEKFATKVKDDWSSCTKRRLTAAVDVSGKLKSTGAQETAVTGWTAKVEQKTSAETITYRVGVAHAGKAVAYTFLTPQKDLDFTATQWDGVTLRAAERTTQVS